MMIPEIEFSCLTYDQQTELKRYWIEGGRIEYKFRGVWRYCKKPGWRPHVMYRKQEMNMKPFRDLTPEERSEILEACLSGVVIEYCSTIYPEWRVLNNKGYLIFDPNFSYRIKPQPASIDWSHVSDDFDKLYYHKKSKQWRICGDMRSYIFANNFSSFKEGDKDIVVYRP